MLLHLANNIKKIKKRKFNWFRQISELIKTPVLKNVSHSQLYKLHKVIRTRVNYVIRILKLYKKLGGATILNRDSAVKNKWAFERKSPHGSSNDNPAST